MPNKRGTVFESVRVGTESVKGTAVAATRFLRSLNMQEQENHERKAFRPEGAKQNTANQGGREWTDGQFDGVPAYNELPFLLSSNLQKVTSPTDLGAGGGSVHAYEWDYNPSSTAPEDLVTYTVEKGSTLGASSFPFCYIPDLSFSSDNQVTMTMAGAIMARGMGNGITLTDLSSTPTPPAVVIDPNTTQTSISTVPGGAGSYTALADIIDYKWQCNGHWKPVYNDNKAQISFSGLVEDAPDMGSTLTVDAGSEADTLLAALKANTIVYVKFSAIGPQIVAAVGGGAPSPAIFHVFEYIIPFFVNKPTRGDHDRVYGVQYDLIPAQDDTFGLCKVKVITTLATLV